MTVPAVADDWPTALTAAFKRAGAAAGPVNLDELLASPEALAARGLTAALLNLSMSATERRLVADAAVRGDLIGFRASGHGEPGQDLRVGYRHADRVEDLRWSDAAQIRLFERYCTWRLSGQPVGTASTELTRLDARLIAVGNYAGRPDLYATVTDLREVKGAERAARLAEYKKLGASILENRFASPELLPGPPVGPGLPRRSWQPEPVAEEPGLAPVAPDDETTPPPI